MVLNTASALLDFCSVFTFLSEGCGGLYRFFVMHMSTLCTLKVFYLHESCFKCFLSVFCFLCCELNHICDAAFVLVLWTDDSQTLRPFVICPVNCCYEYSYEYVVFTSIYYALCLSKIQFKYS